MKLSKEVCETCRIFFAFVRNLVILGKCFAVGEEGRESTSAAIVLWHRYRRYKLEPIRVDRIDQWFYYVYDRIEINFKLQKWRGTSSFFACCYASLFPIESVYDYSWCWLLYDKNSWHILSTRFLFGYLPALHSMCVVTWGRYGSCLRIIFFVVPLYFLSGSW